MTNKTVYLGQYTRDDAERIAEVLTRSGITWWHKQSGPIMRVLSSADWGVRLFVEEARLEEARRIAVGVVGGDSTDAQPG